jgi:hypothetical protein
VERIPDMSDEEWEAFIKMMKEAVRDITDRPGRRSGSQGPSEELLAHAREHCADPMLMAVLEYGRARCPFGAKGFHIWLRFGTRSANDRPPTDAAAGPWRLVGPLRVQAPRPLLF